jgi:hypothetical protein
MSATNNLAGTKVCVDFAAFAARLKSCPDTFGLIQRFPSVVSLKFMKEVIG